MSRTPALIRWLALALLLVACKEPYRVGEYVWVEWEGRDYPAYILEKKGNARFRVHFDGYDARWDEDVTLDRIKGRIDGPVAAPPAPEKVARASGVAPKGSEPTPNASPYKPGDRVRVKWRGSKYVATIVGVSGPDRYLVHYEGYETAWDETVSADRIEAAR
ncbi:MAG: hypothetical protein L6Q84_11245 [Polyangiaceae bacterium]|nr:hypothetical protein [Polyangiaceae bacterium]